MFDLTIYPLSISAGREQTPSSWEKFPGLHIALPPRRAARLRAQDQLILHMQLTVVRGTLLTPNQQSEILTRLAETYYATAGSVTAGLRAVVARLNDFLLNRNLRSAQEGQMSASLNLAALHGGTLMLGHAGPTHSFVLRRAQVLHFDDSGSGRGLGLSRQATPRFYQSELDPGDLLVLCAEPPQGWSPRSLVNSPQMSMEQLRRRLVGSAGIELQAAVIRLQPGNGAITTWRPSERPGTPVAASAESAPPAAPVSSTPPVISNLPVPTAEPRVPAGEPAVHEPEFEDAGLEETSQAFGVLDAPEFEDAAPAAEETFEELSASAPWAAAVSPLPDDGDNGNPSFTDTPAIDTPLEPSDSQPVFLGGAAQQETAPWEPAPEPLPRPAAARSALPAADESLHVPHRRPIREYAPEPEELEEEEREPSSEVLRRNLATALHRGRAARARVGGAVSGVAGKVIPQRSEPLINLSPTLMLAVAIIVPLMVVTIALTVYIRTGRSDAYTRLFQEAQVYVQQASQMQDPVARRDSLGLAIAKIREAERYGKTDEARLLREQSQAALDDLQNFVRLDFQPAVRTAFGTDINIVDMVATLNDVYLLDGASGKILHLERLASEGYQIDPNFNCGPGRAGGAIVGPLVDLAPMPVNNDLRATVMGIDGTGNVVYCAPHQATFDSRPLPLPDMGWGNVTAISIYSSRLYILDGQNNQVYFVDGSESGLFDAAPRLYFDESIPRLGDVLDIAVDLEFLYLLHDNGEMTMCSSGGFTATTCVEPSPYGDNRPGFEPAPITFAGARFTQMQTTQPPDPSLYMLDTVNQSVYHLSLRKLNLQRQYRPRLDSDFPLPVTNPTAFSIAPNRRLLLAFGNQVFYSTLP